MDMTRTQEGPGGNLRHDAECRKVVSCTRLCFAEKTFVTWVRVATVDPHIPSLQSTSGTLPVAPNLSGLPNLTQLNPYQQNLTKRCSPHPNFT
jgi:hypothetical protein